MGLSQAEEDLGVSTAAARLGWQPGPAEPLPPEEETAAPAHQASRSRSAQPSRDVDRDPYMPDVSEQALSEDDEEAESPPKQQQKCGH